MAATNKSKALNATKIPDTEYISAQRASDQEVKARISRTSVLAREYAAEKKLPISISPFYQPHLGKVARIAVNGISIFIPCNGKTYSIPETFAAEIRGKIYRIDRMVQKQEKAASIQFERFAGELKL